MRSVVPVTVCQNCGRNLERTESRRLRSLDVVSGIRHVWRSVLQCRCAAFVRLPSRSRSVSVFASSVCGLGQDRGKVPLIGTPSPFPKCQGQAPGTPSICLRYGNYGRGSASLPASLHSSKSITCLRLRRYLTELRATRKPRLMMRIDGLIPLRYADRQPSAE